MNRLVAWLVVGLSMAGASLAHAQEAIKVAVGQGGNLEAFVTEIGAKGGIFAKHGLNPNVLYTAGGGETLQAVLSHSVDFGLSIGMLGVLGAFEKGAPIRVIGSTCVGSANYWFVKSDSPIHKISDVTGHTLAYSTVGSGTYSIALLVKQTGVDAKLVATGTVPATFTQVMTNQVDVGFSYPEFGQDALADGRIRILFKDNDFERVRGQSIRVITANTAVSDDQQNRFMAAYKETVDWIFSADVAPMKIYAALDNITIEQAENLRDKFWSPALLNPVKVRGVDTLMDDAISGKMLKQLLSAAQLDRLIAPAARP